jgi:hypothetical protein
MIVGRLLSRAGFAAFGAVLAAAFWIGGTQPASAERGWACSYGSASYKRCCNMSYSARPRLGWEARGRDIDACMSGASKQGKRRSR